MLDTAVLARLLLGPDEVPDCRLATLAEYFAAATAPCHRALADAKATADVLAGLLSLAAGTRPAGAAPASASRADPRPGRAGPARTQRPERASGTLLPRPGT